MAREIIHNTGFAGVGRPGDDHGGRLSQSVAGPGPGQQILKRRAAAAYCGFQRGQIGADIFFVGEIKRRLHRGQRPQDTVF